MAFAGYIFKCYRFNIEVHIDSISKCKIRQVIFLKFFCKKERIIVTLCPLQWRGHEKSSSLYWKNIKISVYEALVSWLFGILADFIGRQGQGSCRCPQSCRIMLSVVFLWEEGDSRRHSSHMQAWFLRCRPYDQGNARSLKQWDDDEYRSHAFRL